MTRQEVLIDRATRGYFYLICGHSTDYDVQLVYSVWRPKGTRKFFCEVCGKWVDMKPKPKPEPLPDEPMF